MGKCDCGLPAFIDWAHAFDCPARFNETNRKLAGIDDMPHTEYEIPLDGGRLSLGHDPRNYFGRLARKT